MKQPSKQNRSKDIEIKNKMTVTRGKAEGENGGTKGDGHQGTYIKGTWTSQRGVGSRMGGVDGWGGVGESGGRKM